MNNQILCVAALASLSSLTGVAALGQEVNFTMVGMAVPGETPPLAAELYAARLAEALGDQISITYNDSLLTGPELAPAVRDGRVEMAVANPAYLTSAEPRFGISNLPGLVENAEEYKQLFTEVLDDEFKPLWLEQANAVPLVNGYWSPITLMTTTPIRTVEDFSGKKIRVSNIETGEFVTALGSSPVAISPTEIGLGLERGVIDGFITAVCYSHRQGYFEFSKYINNWGISPVVAWNIVINKDIWDGLSTEVQDVMLQVGKEVQDEIWAETDKLADDCYKIAEESGVEIIDAAPEETAKAYDPEYTERVYEAWYERAEEVGFDGRAFVERAREVLGKS